MNPPDPSLLRDLSDRLAPLESRLAEFPITIGFDAFVDDTIRIVDQRHSPEEYTAMATISDFGDWVKKAAGQSGLREFVLEGAVAGGSSVNMGDGVATMGFPLTAFSGVGGPHDHVFDAFVRKCQAVNCLGMDPGRTIVTEFDDGKVMFCGFSHFSQFTPEYLRGRLDPGGFLAACEKACGIAFTSWSVYPYMNDCWKYLAEEVLAALDHQPNFFFDIADPASRTDADIAAMLEGLGRFQRIGPVTLSINGNEANRLARVLGYDEASPDAESLERLAGQIRAHADIFEVSIHLIKGATTATAAESATIAGPFCPKPKRSVGAGDRFNAGFFAGTLLGLSPVERLALATTTSGYFVRAAESGTWEDLCTFLTFWADELSAIAR